MKDNVRTSFLTDEELVMLSRNGNSNATEQLISRYKSYIAKRASVYYLKGGESEDIIQEGMIGLYKAIIDFDPEKSVSFYSFMKVCVSRQIISAVRSADRKKHMPLNSYVSLDHSQSDDEQESAIGVVSSDSNPESILIDKEYKIGFEGEINRVLSKLELQVLWYYLDGLSYVEIAKRIHKSPKSVDNAISRIKKKLLFLIMK